MAIEHRAGGLQNERFCELWEGLTRGLGGAGRPRPDRRRRRRRGRGRRAAATAGRALLRLDGPGPSLLTPCWTSIGELPLPPYIEAARRRLGTGRARGRRSRALPDRLRRAPGRRGGADRGAALHARRCWRRSRARGPRDRARSRCTSARGRSGPWRSTIRARTGWMPSATGSRPRRADAIARARRRAAAGRRRRDDGGAIAGGVGARARRRGRRPATRRRISACCRATSFQVVTDLDHELPPAALDAADAGRGVRRARRTSSAAYREAVEQRLPLLQLRRRDADPGHGARRERGADISGGRERGPRARRRAARPRTAWWRRPCSCRSGRRRPSRRCRRATSSAWARASSWATRITWRCGRAPSGSRRSAACTGS